jgi:acyl carrier protein
MDRVKIEAKIKDIISEVTGINKDKILNSQSLGEDLGVNSLDLAEISFAIEDELEYIPSDQELDSVITVQDLVDMVADKKGINTY